MVQIKNILWLTDFSSDATHALDYARMLAELHGTKLYLLHVIDNPASKIYGRVEGNYSAMESNARAKSQQWLREHAEKDLGDYPNHEVLLREGYILETVREVEKEKHVGTIVMGTHGRTGMAHLLLGSIAEKVIRSVHCPVYVIRHPDRVSERGAA
jgi:nucleotide-binding universal stress UspA family protein